MAIHEPHIVPVRYHACDWCRTHFHMRPNATRHELKPGEVWHYPRQDHFILWLIAGGHGQLMIQGHPQEIRSDEAVITPAGMTTQLHASTRRRLDIIRVPFDLLIDRKRFDNAISATHLQDMTLHVRHMPTLALHSSMFSLNLGQRLLRVRHQEFADMDQLDAQIQLLRAIYMFRATYLQLVNHREKMPVHRAYSYLLNHRFEADMKLTRVAEHVGLSVSHLIRQFRDKYGASPMKVLARERIAHAKRLLATPDFQIGEIAKVCGYASIAYFCRAFRAEMDMTPTEYRKQCLYQALFIQK